MKFSPGSYQTESIVVKLAEPTKRKDQWLSQMSDSFSTAVQFALDVAQRLCTSSRARIHKAAYYEIRRQYQLPSEYARMAVNAAVSLARSYFGMCKSRHFQRTSFPAIKRSQRIGLGVHAYRLVLNGNRWVLRCSTGMRRKYIWFPLCAPEKFNERLGRVEGDAKLFRRRGNWYVVLPVRVDREDVEIPGAWDDERVVIEDYTFIGVDLGIVRIATISSPNGDLFFNGKSIHHRRERFANLRRRYQRHNRLDKVRAMGGKERRWMKDTNHRLSCRIVDLANEYDHPVIVFERLDGIRNRTRGSKGFNRMIASWAFRQLIAFVRYKAARKGIPVVSVDPRGTSTTCNKCGHNARASRSSQVQFRCVACGCEMNADLNAARNIAARGPSAFEQEPSDTAPGHAGIENAPPWPE